MLKSVLTFDDLVAIAPEQIWLPISEKAQEQARQQAQQPTYSHPEAYNRAYRSYLCLNLIHSWLESEQDTAQPINVSSPTQTPEELWEFVEGIAITLGDIRIVVIPNEAIVIDEFSIPREWVDIPGWASHYYFAVYINSEGQYLHLAGYTTHETVKNKAIIDYSDQTYRLLNKDLTTDFKLFWVARSLLSIPAIQAAPISPLSPIQSTHLIQKLTQILDYSPRLDCPYEQWIALIENSETLHEMYQRRSQPLPTAFNRWSEGIFTTGWQVIQDLTDLLDATPAMAIAKSALPGNSQIRKKEIFLGSYQFELTVVQEFNGDQKDTNMTGEIGVFIQSRLINQQALLPAPLQVTVSFQQSENAAPTYIRRSIPPNAKEPVVKIPKLVGKPGERFSIYMTLGDWSSQPEYFQL